MRQLLFFILVAVLVSSFLHLRSEKLPETDVLYHFAHADVYRMGGVFQSEFPWVSASSIKSNSADIWYGFHILLIPFTLFSNQIFGIKIASIFITSVFLLLMYLAFLRLKIKYSFFWPFSILFAGAHTLYHFFMARPHALSAALSMLFFAFLLNGGTLGIFLISFLFSFIHLSLFWLPVLIFAVFIFFQLIYEKSLEWEKTLALFAGLLLGWVARPNPIGAFQIAYIQIIELIKIKSRSIPLRFGLELQPLGLGGAFLFWTFLIFWTAGIFIFVAYFLRRGERERFNLKSRFKIGAISALFLSVSFFFMSVFIAQRSSDFWIIFGTLFISLLYSEIIQKYSRNKKIFITTFGLVIVLVFGAQSIYRHGQYLNQIGVNSLRFRESASWLAQYSKKGEIVYNTSWDQFPELFFWNRNNYYIGGMDPIFQYTKSPELYWESYFIETGQASSKTCSRTLCEVEDQKDIYEALKNDFNASYIFMQKPEDFNLYNYLKTDSRFSLKTEDSHTAVFEIK